MQTVFLHVGYHKTATTFMQNLIYPNLTHVNYLDKDTIKPEIQQIRFKKNSNQALKEIHTKLNLLSDERPFLISHEGLTGSPFSSKQTKPAVKILADLRRLFPESQFDVHILLGIREQVNLLTSLYVQHIHFGGVLTAPEFTDACKSNGALQNFHFSIYIKAIENLFGLDHLFVMVHEHLKTDFQGELLKLLNYMGEKAIPEYKNTFHWHNKSLGTSQVAIARFLNKLFRSKFSPNAPFPVIKLPFLGNLTPRRLLQNKVSFALHYKKFQFQDELKQSLKKEFVDGNQALISTYKLDLPIDYLSRTL